MSNSVFHNIYTEKYHERLSNVIEENNNVITTFRLMCLETVLNTFVWKGLPDGIMSYMPERYACWWGTFAAFRDDDGEIKIFPAYPSGAINENGLYEHYTMVALNGRNWRRSLKDVVLCFNNTLATPSIGIINELAEKMSTALRAVDCALERSLIPTVFSTPNPEDFKTLSGLYDSVKNQLPFRVMQSDSVVNELKVVNDAFDSGRYNVTEMFEIFTKYRNLFNQIFGINALNVIKRERLTPGELTGDEEQATFTLINGMYERRQEFCKNCNSKFGTNISFDISRNDGEIYKLKADDIELMKNYVDNDIQEVTEDE